MNILEDFFGTNQDGGPTNTNWTTNLADYQTEAAYRNALANGEIPWAEFMAQQNQTPQVDNSGSSGGSGVDYATQEYNRGYLNDQKSQLEQMLGRTEGYLKSGLENINKDYEKNVGLSNQDKEKAMAGYKDQRMAAEKNKGNAFTTANKNAGNAYRSLAQILGRAGGTGSSAFQNMLPNVVGNALNTNRQGAIETYGTNVQGIKKNEDQYGLDFAQILQDLADQKTANEKKLKGGIDAQKASINQQLAQILGSIVQNENPNASYEEVRAAQTPYQTAVNQLNQSADQYNAWTPTFTPRQAVAQTTPLSEFTANRFAINQQNNQGQNSNPYEALLRKKLTEK